MGHPNSQLRGLGFSRKMEVDYCRGRGHSKEAVGVGEMRRCVCEAGGEAGPVAGWLW